MEQKNPNQNKPTQIKTWEPNNFNRQSIPSKLAGASTAYGRYTIDLRTGNVKLFNLGINSKGDIGEVVTRLYRK